MVIEQRFEVHKQLRQLKLKLYLTSNNYDKNKDRVVSHQNIQQTLKLPLNNLENNPYNL